MMVYPLVPGLALVINRSGWYRLDWDGRDITAAELSKAVLRLAELVDTGEYRPARGPAESLEDHYRTIEEAFAELNRHTSET